MNNSNSQRQDHLDCAHGLMILQMMFFHLCVSTIYGTPVYYQILHPLSFFMAWFFFKSGMFFKKIGLVENLQLGFKKLILPALIFSIIGFIFYLIFEKPSISFSYELGFFYVFGAFRGNTPIWFLFSLFAVQIIASLIHKFNITPILTVVISLGIYCLNKNIGFRPYWTYNIPLGLMFFSLGQILKDIQYNKKSIIISIAVFCGLFFIHTNINFRDGVFSPAIITMPWALAGCILTNVLFKSVPRLCIAPLRFFGKHAMEFYCTHIIIIAFIEWIIHHNKLLFNSIVFEYSAFLIYIILFAIILHFFKLRHIQWMFGKTNQS